MKKLILLPILCLMLAGCSVDETGPNTFKKLCEHHVPDGYTAHFYVDNDTDNIYIKLGRESGFAPYINKKGEVMQYDEFYSLHGAHLGPRQ